MHILGNTHTHEHRSWSWISPGYVSKTLRIRHCQNTQPSAINSSTLALNISCSILDQCRFCRIVDAKLSWQLFFSTEVLICYMCYLVQLWVISVKSSTLQWGGKQSQPVHISQSLYRCTHCVTVPHFWRSLFIRYIKEFECILYDCSWTRPRAPTTHRNCDGMILIVHTEAM